MRQRTDQFPTPATGSAGFTLVELMVVLAIFSLLLSLAAPSFNNIIANNRVTSAANNVITILNLGKGEAVRSGQSVTLCKRASNSACSTDTSGDWSNGWVLFAENVDDNGKIDSGERIIRVQSDLEVSLDFAYTGGSKVGFGPNGSTGPAGHFCLRNDNDDNKSRAVTISDFGRFRIKEQAYDC